LRRTALIGGGLALLVGASAALVHPMAALGLVLGLALAVWVFSSALNATLAFIVFLVLRPADLFPVLVAVQPAKIVGLGAIFLWLVTKLLRGELQLSRAPHGKWMVALFLGALLSSLTSSDRATSMAMLTDGFVKLLLMYALVVHMVDTKSRAVKLHLTLAWCTVLLAVYAVHMRHAGLATVEGNRATFVGLLNDPNDLAIVLLMYVPLFAELAMSEGGARRLVWVLPLVVLIVGIFTTVSRGGALGLVVALGVTFHDRVRGGFRFLLLPALAAAVLGLIVVAGVNDRTSGALNQTELDESSQVRLDAWEAGLRMTISNPLFGVGFTQFAQNYPDYAWDPVRWGPTEAHNSYVKVAAETGMVGFIPFMALVILTFRSAYRLRQAEVPEDSPKERAVRRSLLPAMTGFCVAAFFLSQSWGWFLFILFAQSAALHEIWKSEVDLSPRSVSAHEEQKRNKLEPELC